MGIADFIGRRGEAIAYTHLSSKFRREDLSRPYFILHHLGEKFRTFDYLVELEDTGGTPLFFLIQVKTTRKATTRSHSPPRLRVEVSEDDVLRMVACPIPSYVVGVHEIEERAFIIAVHGDVTGAISSITTAHELTPDTLRKLWEEVRESWRVRDVTRSTSSFANGGGA